jgi:flagellar basal-body rod protein FlgC
MNAATRRLEVSASNVANVMTTGALPATNGTVATGPPQAYQPLRLNETASANGGTQTSVTASAPSYVAISDPQAPFANQNGLVAAPNVDISQEMINQMIASYSFTANAGVLKAEDLMTKTLLDTTA